MLFSIALAQGTSGAHTQYATQLVNKVKSEILFPLIALMIGVAILIFLYGIFQMVRGAENAEARENGRRHMLAGIIGIVVMLSALTLLQIAVRTIWGEGQATQYIRQ